MKTDFQIQREVREGLTWEPAINAKDITVSVKNGIVTLAGSIENYSKKDKLEKVTKRVGGVKKVLLDLTIPVPPENFKTQSAIDQNVSK